jgi:hypothetical protein
VEQQPKAKPLSDGGAESDGLLMTPEEPPELRRASTIAHFFLAAGLAQLSRIEEARAAIKTGLALNPMFTIHRFRAGAESDNLTFLTQRERIYEGMRKAGVPEQ